MKNCLGLKMQKILNLLPIITFFIIYKAYDIFIACKFLIIISGIIFILNWIIYKKIEKINLINFILITIFFMWILFVWYITIFFSRNKCCQLLRSGFWIEYVVEIRRDLWHYSTWLVLRPFYLCLVTTFGRWSPDEKYEPSIREALVQPWTCVHTGKPNACTRPSALCV